MVFNQGLTITARIFKAEEYFIKNEPYYEATGNEIDIFKAAYNDEVRARISGIQAKDYNLQRVCDTSSFPYFNEFEAKTKILITI